MYDPTSIPYPGPYGPETDLECEYGPIDVFE